MKNTLLNQCIHAFISTSVTFGYLFFSYWNLIWLVFIKVKHFRYWFRIFLHINYTVQLQLLFVFNHSGVFSLYNRYVFLNFKQKMNIFGIMLKGNLWILDFKKKKFHFFHNWISEKVISTCTKFTWTKNDNLIKMSTNS